MRKSLLRSRPKRRATVLLLVLVLIPLLAFGGYAFTHAMRAESTAAITAAKRRQALWLARSGVEMVRALLADPNNLDPTKIDLFDNPGRFAGQLVTEDGSGSASYFSIVSPPEDPAFAGLRFGLTNEGSKIPLGNSQLLNNREALMGLPNMTTEIADAILDWIDADDMPRENGAESSYYAQLTPPIKPRNGPIKTIGELLLIKGVTPALLYGEDYNLSGVLDTNKNDSDKSWPADNSDGSLDRGWYHYLTLESSSPNLSPEGELKTNLNGDIAEIGSALSEKFGAEFIAFLTAYKQQNPQIKSISELIDKKIQVPAGGAGGAGGQPIASSITKSGSTTTTATSGTTFQVTTQGNSGGAGAGQPQTVEMVSPWTSKNVGQYLETAMEELTVSGQQSIKNLIDVNRAPAPVLRCLPGITEEIADRIASASQARTADDITPAWLLLEGLVTLEQFQKIEPYITAGGRVFRVESVGYFDSGTTSARVEAIIDASGTIPKVIRMRELPPGGPSFTPQLLSGGAIGSR